MAKVSLRVYNHEIEHLIDQGHLQEAIAHCRHILQSFSKHLDTYRLLGKAYLESKRYSEAVDVFSRVLMAVPDDFVSHVGMSIIRDDQNKLDDAIWHMERAFEAQPSNAAIQAELQRLFGRRDGTQPPKIRMTRGALAHMYIQGELYPQAISEIKAVLAQDNQRDDMKALLARAYFHSGQRADASDICSQLLNRYAYSFDANRIMLELLQGSEITENVKAYRQRVHELDPYSAFTDSSVFRSNEVSDAAVSLERLEYRGQEVDLSTDWSEEGAEPVEKPEGLEWMRSNETPATAEEPVLPSETTGDIPDFMRQAGWREASGIAQEPTTFEIEPEVTGGEELAQSDMPEWLKAMAPSEGEGSTPLSRDSDMPDWLNDMRGEAPASNEPADIPEWLKGLDEAESQAGPALEEADLPDWLRASVVSTPIIPETTTEPAVAELEPFDEPTPLEPEIFDEKGFIEFEASEELAPVEPLIEPESVSGELPIEIETAPEPAFVEPEALEEPVFIVPEALVEPVVPEPETAPEASMFEPAPAEPEMLPEETAVVTPEVGAVTPLPSLATLGMSTQEQDDAMAWLESLAAKHGAKSEELVTDPSARSEKPPAWVEQALALGESQAVITEPISKEPALAETPGAEVLAPVEASMAEEAVLQEQPAPEAAALVEEAPEEVPVIPEPVSEIPSLVDEPEPVAPSMDELGVRLSQLIGEEVKPQEPEEGPFQAEPVEEEYAGSRTDMPDWLSRVDSASQNEEVTQPITPIQIEKAETEMPELPDWLRGLDEEQKWPAPASLSDELPSWLQGEPDLPAQAEPTVPADWRSMEAEGESQPEVLPVIEPRPEPELPLQGIFEAAPEMGSELPAEYEPEPEPEQMVRRQPAPPASKKAPVRPAPERRQAGILAPVSDPELAAARSEMKRGDIPSALEHYERLIKKGRWLEEIIRDLRDALYRYPVEVTVWQTLGDAYMRENRLQEALDSYTKAEELLR